MGTEHKLPSQIPWNWRGQVYYLKRKTLDTPYRGKVFQGYSTKVGETVRLTLAHYEGQWWASAAVRAADLGTILVEVLSSLDPGTDLPVGCPTPEDAIDAVNQKLGSLEEAVRVIQGESGWCTPPP